MVRLKRVFYFSIFAIHFFRFEPELSVVLLDEAKFMRNV